MAGEESECGIVVKKSISGPGTFPEESKLIEPCISAIATTCFTSWKSFFRFGACPHD